MPAEVWNGRAVPCLQGGAHARERVLMMDGRGWLQARMTQVPCAHDVLIG